MKTSVQRCRRAIVSALCGVTLVFAASNAHAGPPLVCHPLSIGDAKSLPSGDGPFGYDRSYDRAGLVEETMQLLTPEMPVIVRMETLRRATLYASRSLRNIGHPRDSYSEEDRRIALDLLSRLMARALAADSKGPPDPLAWFDVGYYLECLGQARLVEGFDGYSLVKSASKLRPNDVAMEFANALITKWPARKAHAEHARRAKAAMRPGSLVAINFARVLGKKGTN